MRSKFRVYEISIGTAVFRLAPPFGGLVVVVVDKIRTAKTHKINGYHHHY